MNVLYINKRASSEAFQEVMQAFLAAGYYVSSAPAQNRDGCAARLKKEEEIWIEWSADDSLSISTLGVASEHLQKEVSQVLSGAAIKEVRVI